jgi:hypothetical protein
MEERGSSDPSGSLEICGLCFNEEAVRDPEEADGTK